MSQNGGVFLELISKKKEVACRLNAPRALSNKARIVRSEKKIDET